MEFWQEPNGADKARPDLHREITLDDGKVIRIACRSKANNVGWMRLPLEYECNGKTTRCQFSFEVLPTKMHISQDLHAMYQAIDKTFLLWRFSLVEKKKLSVDTPENRLIKMVVSNSKKQSHARFGKPTKNSSYIWHFRALP